MSSLVILVRGGVCGTVLGYVELSFFQQVGVDAKDRRRVVVMMIVVVVRVKPHAGATATIASSVGAERRGNEPA